MVDCYVCGASERIPFKCSYCQNTFCNIHRNPVNHSCPFLNIYDAKRKKMLLDGNKNYRTVSARTLKIKTSKTELLHLGVATLLVMGVGLSLNGYRFISWQFLAIFISAFLVHELAHKFLAQYYGSWAEFRAYMWGLVITGISALPIMPFKFIAPGAVMIGLSDRSKFGRVALIGPLTNLAMGFSFLLLSFLFNSLSPYFAAGASFNGWIALFNLMPIGVLDGQKILDWNKVIWGITMAAASGLFIIAYL
jgi:Zn-dependent protease